jgi:hypothetical protein
MSTHYNITQEVINALPVPFDEFYRGRLPPDLEEYKSFYEPCGREHYRLLTYLSTLVNSSTIIEIGTHKGLSAIALSYNSTNTIHTFDTEKKVVPAMDKISNIYYHPDNLFDRAKFMTWAPIILLCPFIVVSVDTHNGTMEIGFMKLLEEIGYSGFVVWDGIWQSKGMRNEFWYHVSDKMKYDLTLVGHLSGTGVTTFNPNITFEKNDNTRWTLVTAYFDLTQFDDATREIKERDDAHYMSNARSTMALPYNLVVYCEEKHLDALREMRPPYLRDRVLYKVVDFDNLYFRKERNSMENKDMDNVFSNYREIIKNNRAGNPYYVENRNTPSYYLLCMARYIIMKETIETNPFGSTHFCWINVCIERMGYINLVHLDEALGLYRDKFSSCYIDYIPEGLVNDTEEYFKWGRCGMCSGFFTGNAHYMWTVSNLIENKFIEYVHKGYGHSDEQLYSPVYFKNPELFEHYYGDYQQMITNYAWIYEAPTPPILNFIRNSFACHNFVKCYEACRIVWESYCRDKCLLSLNDKISLCYYYMLSEKECLPGIRSAIQ